MNNSMKIPNNMALTPTHQRFATDNHHIVENFLEKRNLTFEDYYEAVIFPYLCAVRLYFRHPEIRTQPFQNVAKRFMNFAVYNHRRNRRFEKRELNTVSLNTAVSPKTHLTFMETIPAAGTTSENTGCEQLWKKIESVTTPEEADILRMKADGYNDKEISERHHTPSGVRKTNSKGGLFAIYMVHLGRFNIYERGGPVTAVEFSAGTGRGISAKD